MTTNESYMDGGAILADNSHSLLYMNVYYPRFRLCIPALGEKGAPQDLYNAPIHAMICQVPVRQLREYQNRHHSYGL